MTTEEIDTAMTVDRTSADTIQQTYFATHQRYRHIKWVNTLLNPQVIYSVDCYDGPNGKGYVLNVWAIDINMYRSINRGPEAYRDAAWVSSLEQ